MKHIPKSMTMALVSVMTVYLASCAPATQADVHTRSHALRASPDEVISALALIAPRLPVPQAHTRPHVSAMSNVTMTLEGEDLSVAQLHAVSQAVMGATPRAEGFAGAFLQGLARAQPKPTGTYRVQVRTIAQDGGMTIVSIGSDNERGGWLVAALTAELEQHFRGG